MQAEKNFEKAEDARPVPSQAEGDDPVTGGDGLRPRPSQAEGDEESVEESLRRHEHEG